MDPIASFSGLASGIQWQDMIDQIMKLESARSVDPLRNRVGTQAARIDAWKVYEGLVSKLKSASVALKDGTSFGLYKTTAGTTGAGRALISATASTSATPGSYRVEVIALARAEKLSGRNEVSTTAALGLDGQVVVNGHAVDITASDTLNDVRDRINAANTGTNASGVTATILTTGTSAHRLILTADHTGSRGIELVDSATTGGILQQLGVVDGTLAANTSRTDSSRTESQRFATSTAKLATLLGVSPAPAQTTITIGGQKISVDLANDTLIDIMNRINPDPPTEPLAKPAMIVEETVGGRTQYRLSVGGAVEADSGPGIDSVLSQRVVELLGFQRGIHSGEIAAGSDAIASIDGFRVTRRSNVVPDAITGVSINLLAADTAGRTASTTGGALAVTVDPKSISVGTHAVNFEATTSRTATSAGAGLAVVSQSGVDNGSIADGTYDVALTLASPTKINGGTIGGVAATWDDVTQTLTANAGTALEGISVAYGGPPTSGVVGSVTVASNTTLDGVTIGGEAADWDPATATIRGRAGSRFEGVEIAYAGPVSYAGTVQPGHVGDLVVSGEIAVDLTIARDTDGTVSAIKAYTDAYNGIRDFIARQQSSGDVLASNGTLRTTGRSLTEVMLKDVESLAGTTFSRAATAGLALNRDGILVLDTAALTAALQASPNDVKALFGGVGDAMYRATDAIAASFSGTVASQIRSLQESNAALDLRIGDVEQRLELKRQSMIQQYTRMETMISQMQSQGSWLAQQIQSMQPSAS